MKYLCFILFSILSINTYAETIRDGYHTQIPCFKFNVKTLSGNETKINYKLTDNLTKHILQIGTIVANKGESSVIQWCDKDLSHVQKFGNLNFGGAYTLTINGIKFKDLNVGSTMNIKYDVKLNSFSTHLNGHYEPIGKDAHIGQSLSIIYNDILNISNSSIYHNEFGNYMNINDLLCAANDPRCGDHMTYKASDSRTWWGISVFRKTWFVADLTIPEQISSYYSINTRNLKISGETKDSVDYTPLMYHDLKPSTDNDDKDVVNLIWFNSMYSNTAILDYFTGYCSGIGVVNGVLYASCRFDPSKDGKLEEVTSQRITYLSYKTACQQETKNIAGVPTTNARIRVHSNTSFIDSMSGTLQCVLYKSDFPQGEYLNSCPGVNYDPTNRTLTTDCYDNNKKLVNHVIELGVMGTQTPHYKNVNGSLVAY